MGAASPSAAAPSSGTPASGTPTSGARRPGVTTVLKVVGTLLAGWTVVFLGLFAVAEGAEGVGHLVQFLPLVIAIGIAWRWPIEGGLILIVVGSTLALLYPVVARGPLEMIVSTELVLLLPPVAGGVLFVVAGLRSRPGAATASPHDRGHRGAE